MMRRTFFIGMALCVLAAPYATTSAQLASSTFPDVEAAGHDYRVGIDAVARVGIMQGNPDGTFRPDDSMNRAEFTKTILNALGTQQESATCLAFSKLRFPDVPYNAWYAPYVCAAVQRGIIKGYPNGTFGPAKPVTFAEAAIMMQRAGIASPETLHDSINNNPRDLIFGIHSLQKEASVIQPFAKPPDTPNQPWFRDSVEALAARGAIPLSITGFGAPVTRAEIAEILYRLRFDITDQASQEYRSLPCNTDFRVAYSLQDALSRPNEICELILVSVDLNTLNTLLPGLPFLNSLTITNAGLTEIPKSVFGLRYLQELDLSENHISLMPPEIGNLPSLERLILRENLLKSLPDTLANLGQLSYLDLESNDISTLPESIAGAQNIAEINLSNNAVDEKEQTRVRLLLPNVELYF